MRRKTLYRALAVACLLSVLAACARDRVPPEEMPAAVTYTTPPEIAPEWYTHSGAAMPRQAARELVAVMLANYQALPESERKLTITEYSVGEQELYAWEDVPLTVM